jgi:hypothetical protein
MRRVWTFGVVVGLAAIAGCSRQPTTECEPDSRYATARSAPPVQIPDDLSPPNEADALRLPPPAAAASASAPGGGCLHEPPPFSGDSRPFVEVEEESRQTRREARRAAREAASAEQSDSDQPEESERSPDAEDRVIDN